MVLECGSFIRATFGSMGLLVESWLFCIQHLPCLVHAGMLCGGLNEDTHLSMSKDAKMSSMLKTLNEPHKRGCSLFQL